MRARASNWTAWVRARGCERVTRTRRSTPSRSRVGRVGPLAHHAADGLHSEPIGVAIQRGRGGEGSLLKATGDLVQLSGVCANVPRVGTSRNTVQLVITMVSVKCFESLDGDLCVARFLGHLDILRLMTRGLMRLRRGGSCSCCSSPISAAYQAAKD